MLGIPVRGMIVIGVFATAGLLYLAGGDKLTGAAQSAGRASECKVTVMVDILNVRSGPADTQPIVATLQRDAVAHAERKVENGYRMLGEGRWVSGEFVAPTSDSDCG
jgi:hypothetical protein